MSPQVPEEKQWPSRFEKTVNKLLSKVWPEDAQRNRKVRFHLQNLNVDKNDQIKGWPVEGRWWLYVNNKTVHRFSWHLWTHFCGLGIRSDSEDGGLMLHAALPPVALWVTLPIPVQKWLQTDFWAKWNERYGGHKGSHRYTSFRIAEINVHDWSVYWSFLQFDWGWSHKMPKWMSGSLNLTDTFLGKLDCQTEVVESKDVHIPMPEGLYAAKAKLEKRTRSRPRWFPKEAYSIWLDIPLGIPHQGKGENSWDCGPDGLFGCGVDGTSYEAAIAHAVEISLRDRRKYDGNMMAQYPNPVKMGGMNGAAKTDNS